MASRRAGTSNGRRRDCPEATSETWRLRFVSIYRSRGRLRRADRVAEALKAENDELRKTQGASHISHAQAPAQYGFPSDDILPSGFQDRTSPYAPSDHDILMQ